MSGPINTFDELKKRNPDFLCKAYIEYAYELSSDFHNQFTPFALCDEILDKLPLDGDILVVANLEFVYRLKTHGVDPSKIYYATPCGRVKARHAVKAFGLPIENVFVYDYNRIKEEKYWDELMNGRKFDVVVGNPPFQQGGIGKNRTLYHKFYSSSILLAKHYIGLVSPTGFLYSNKKMFQQLRRDVCNAGMYHVQEYNSQEILNITCDYFGAVYMNKQCKSNSFIIVRNNRTYTLPLTSNIVHLSDDVTLNMINRVKKEFTDTLYPYRGRQKQINKNGKHVSSLSEIQTISHQYPVINRLKQGIPEIVYSSNIINDHLNKYRIVYNMISRQAGLGQTHIDKGTGTQLTQIVCYIPCETGIEALSLQSYFNSKLFNLFVGIMKAGVANSLGVIRQIPRPVDTSILWTDQELYQHFNLTDEEVKLIEETIK